MLSNQWEVATALTVYGIETHLHKEILVIPAFRLQQPLPSTVCAEGCETAEEQSDDEVRTSQVPERSEGKAKVIRQQHLPFTVLKLTDESHFTYLPFLLVATAPIVYGMRRRVRDGRGAKRR